jgi:hypothetical protein
MVDYEEATRNEAAAVDAASVKVCAYNGGRKVIAFRNTSPAGQVLTLNFGSQPAVANAGLVMSVGQFYIDSDSEGYLCWKGTVTAISSAVGGILSIFER